MKAVDRLSLSPYPSRACRFYGFTRTMDRNGYGPVTAQSMARLQRQYSAQLRELLTGEYRTSPFLAMVPR